jgi:hypothetical protein
MQLYERVIQNFLIGGSVIALVSFLASFENPVIAAIIWSYPLSIVPSMYNMKQNHHSDQYIAKFLFSTTFALLLLVICTLTLAYYLSRSKPSESITPAVLKSTVIWGICSVIFYIIAEYGGYKKYFF